MIDLRSDTVTRPCQAMRAAIASAEVADDVIEADPTVDRLEQLTAEMLGKEAAIFMPSGTMTNQAAIRFLCQPGDEFICEESSHIYNYQQGAFAQLSGVVARTVFGADGLLTVEDIQDKIRPDNQHMVRTRLVCLENTHNRASGRIHAIEDVEAITQWARDNGLKTHLDGARLFNAVIATGVDAARWARGFDTISICYSKGLGAPVGSALVGSHEAIQAAVRHRKVFGGGMRQAGIIAAGALYGMEHNIERLAEDHVNAQRLGAAINELVGCQTITPTIDSNIVIFAIDGASQTDQFLAGLKERGVLLSRSSPTELRAVTHLDVSADQIDTAIKALSEVAESQSVRS